MAVEVDRVPLIGRSRGARLIHLTAGIWGIMLLVLAGCAGSRLPARTRAAATSGATAQGAAGQAGTPLAAGPGDTLRPEGTTFVDGSGGLLRVTGIDNHPLREGRLALHKLKKAPAAPPHWELRTPVFDITAQDEQERPVTRLDEALVLHFRVAADGLMTVLVYDGSAWQVVPSEIDADGSLSASITHLTPYAVGGPAVTSRSAAPTARLAPGSHVTADLAPAARAAGTRIAGVGSASAGDADAGPAQAASAALTSVPLTVTPVAQAEAQAALVDAVQALKGHPVKVTMAQGYTGALYVAVPPALQGALQSAMEIGGAGYFGLYNALNQALTLRGYGQNGSGSLTLLVEPKTTLPAGAVDAMTQVTALFPGIGIPLTQVQAGTEDGDAYTFYALDDNTAYATGYVSYEGIVLAYAMSGTGAYQALVPR